MQLIEDAAERGGDAVGDEVSTAYRLPQMKPSHLNFFRGCAFIFSYISVVPNSI